MSRILFIDEQRDLYFSTLKSDRSWTEIANTLKVNKRTLRDWQTGKTTFPLDIAKKIKKLYGINLPDAEILKKHWYASKAGHKGALKRMQIYGNPGTPEGRRKGGIKSLIIHKKLKTGFILRKEIKNPDKADLLAEFIGIVIGDGSISNYQVRITLNKITDKQYSQYVKRLMDRLFGIKSSIYLDRQDCTIDVVGNGANIVDFLVKKGMVKGDKIRQKIDIPFWIKNNLHLTIDCLRGLFDTDGSTYFDKHVIRGRLYKSLNIDFTSYSEPLYKTIYNILMKLNFSPTTSSRNRIRLRQTTDVIRLFKLMKPKNAHHLLRFKKFMEGYPSGRTGTVSKTV